MTFDDDLRQAFRRADGVIPRRDLDWDATISRARRERAARLVAGVVVGAALLAGVAFATQTMLSNRPEPLPPAGETSEAPSSAPASPTPSAGLLEPPPEVDSGSCSAAREARPVDAQEELPEQVQHMRANIIFAAWNCDYDELEKYTGLTHGEEFTYSFGEDGNPSAYWKRLEAADPGEDVTAALVTALAMDFKKEKIDLEPGAGPETLYIWPRASSSMPTEADWQEVVEAGLHSQREVDQMREYGHYLGYRIGILPNGDWIYYVAGD